MSLLLAPVVWAGLIEDELSVNQFSSPYGHFSAYAAIEQTEVVAVANRGVERLKRFTDRFGITNTYLDYREMIEQEKPGHCECDHAVIRTR